MAIKQSLLTSRFEVVDENGERHCVSERAVFRTGKYLHGGTAAAQALKEYLIGSRRVRKLDDATFETADGSLRMRRI